MSETLSDYGITIELPDGWYGELFRNWNGIEDSGPVLHIASTPLVLGDMNTYASETRGSMRPEDAVAVVVNLPSMPHLVSREDFEDVGPTDGWSLAGATDLPFHGVGLGSSSLRKDFRVGQRVFDLVAFFGSAPPPDAAVQELEGILAGIRIDISPGERGDRLDQFFDVDAAVRIDAEVREQIWARDRDHLSAEEQAEYLQVYG